MLKKSTIYCCSICSDSTAVTFLKVITAQQYLVTLKYNTSELTAHLSVLLITTDPKLSTLELSSAFDTKSYRLSVDTNALC